MSPCEENKVKEGVTHVQKEQLPVLNRTALCQKHLVECTWLTGKGGLQVCVSLLTNAQPCELAYVVGGSFSSRLEGPRFLLAW